MEPPSPILFSDHCLLSASPEIRNRRLKSSPAPSLLQSRLSPSPITSPSSLHLGFNRLFLPRRLLLQDQIRDSSFPKLQSPSPSLHQPRSSATYLLRLRRRLSSEPRLLSLLRLLQKPPPESPRERELGIATRNCDPDQRSRPGIRPGRRSARDPPVDPLPFCPPFLL